MKRFAAVVIAVLASTSAAACAPQGGESRNLATGCTSPKANEVSCPLRIGRSTYRLTAAMSQYLHLTNTTGRALQIESVAGAPARHDLDFLEFCISRDTFSIGQEAPSDGEVGCATQYKGGTLGAIRWLGGTRGSGLSVAPGDTVFVASDQAKADGWFDVTVNVAAGGGDFAVWRQPRRDQSIVCDGTEQATLHAPWTNTTQQTLGLSGALIYAGSGKAANIAKVDAACVTILDTQSRVRFKQCAGLDGAGPAAIAPQVLRPGESIAGAARNTCPAGHRWDWAAYLVLSP